jgi:hypothetical protein
MSERKFRIEHVEVQNASRNRLTSDFTPCATVSEAADGRLQVYFAPATETR